MSIGQKAAKLLADHQKYEQEKRDMLERAEKSRIAEIFNKQVRHLEEEILAHANRGRTTLNYTAVIQRFDVGDREAISRHLYNWCAQHDLIICPDNGGPVEWHITWDLEWGRRMLREHEEYQEDSRDAELARAEHIASGEEALSLEECLDHQA